MDNQTKTPNRLINEKSPYLLQHAYNPVDWYPWGKEAFEKAKQQDKPIFLSIGYSTCHWCHVMEAESFENKEVAQILNTNFISVKVDKEERPDIDNIYMQACQAFTGSGGWPTSLFITSDQKPFYAGTYFPKDIFIKILCLIKQKWHENKAELINSSDKIVSILETAQSSKQEGEYPPAEQAVSMFTRTFDREYGGFGSAPKFPSPHNLMFLLYTSPPLAEKTLLQMYKGGIFDHIGYGFSRYSTDRFWLAPHFEKMLYDNALLCRAYLLCFEQTGNVLYKSVAEKIMVYIEREMMSPEGGFYCAQDADSDGEEGKYYTLDSEEVIRILGCDQGKYFNDYFDITPQGNFEGKNIPNLIAKEVFDANVDALLPKVYHYRKARTKLHLDYKILTGWNSLMLAAYADAYRITGDSKYLKTAEKSVDFIEKYLTDGNVVFSGVTNGKRGEKGFLDDYAFYIFALISMHQATLDNKYLARAMALTDETIIEFFDHENGGFFFSGSNSEPLILRTKETFDNAIPSGNSMMVYNLSRLSKVAKRAELLKVLEKQQRFMNGEALRHPQAFGFYLYATLPMKSIVCAIKDNTDLEALKVRSNWFFMLSTDPKYPLLNDKTTYYVCEDTTCLPPTNQLPI